MGKHEDQKSHVVAPMRHSPVTGHIYYGLFLSLSDVDILVSFVLDLYKKTSV